MRGHRHVNPGPIADCQATAAQQCAQNDPFGSYLQTRASEHQIVHIGGYTRWLPRTNPLRGQRALEEIRSRIGTAASRGAVIGLEQGWISRSWQPDATTSRWRPWPNPGFRMFRVVQHEWEETGMHLR